MVSELIQYAVLAATLAFAVMTAVLKDMLYAALSLGAMCVSLGVLYWVLFAPYVGLFQMLIYGGAVVVLFVAVVMFVRGDEDG